MSSNDRPVVRRRVSELEPGQTLARAVHADNGCRLLSEGCTLEQDDIERLKRHNRRTVRIDDPDHADAEGD